LRVSNDHDPHKVKTWCNLNFIQVIKMILPGEIHTYIFLQIRLMENQLLNLIYISFYLLIKYVIIIVNNLSKLAFFFFLPVS
jgi:hypothetical protein